MVVTGRRFTDGLRGFPEYLSLLAQISKILCKFEDFFGAINLYNKTVKMMFIDSIIHSIL